MTPQTQTIFGHPDGNCLSACIASILDIPIAEVPTFRNDETAHWTNHLLSWLGARGYGLVYIHGEGKSQWWDGNIYEIAVGKSPRGDWDHCVVEQTGCRIFDPHPDGTFLEGETKYWLIPVPFQGKK